MRLLETATPSTLRAVIIFLTVLDLVAVGFPILRQKASQTINQH